MYTSHSYPYQLNGNNQQQQQQPRPHPPYPPPRQQFPNPYAQQQQPQPPQYQPPSTQPQPLFQTHPKKAPQPPTQQPPQQPPPQPSQPPQYSAFTPGTQPFTQPGTQPYSPPGTQPVPMPRLHVPQPDPTPQTQMPDQEMGDPRFVELMSFSTEELTGFLEDDDKVNEMVQNLEEVKQKKLDKEMSIAENKSLADFNLSREPRLTESRSQYIIRLQEAQKCRESHMLGKAKLESVKDQTSLDTALALLQAATAHAEEDSEEVADEFLKGDITVDDFLEKFMPKRQTAHLRHIKSEKMQEILTKRQQQQSAPQSGATQNSAMPPYPASHHQQYAPQGNRPYAPQGTQPYGYHPQRPAPRPPVSYPYGGPQYGPGAQRMPTLGPYQQ
ncbi:uncharacterized protein [Asterias amurensis]|uniref:uncharacterized protein n=1 Tax=Asterias amurensis TaxID=7602 RepID=UPI003AB45918